MSVVLLVSALMPKAPLADAFTPPWLSTPGGGRIPDARRTAVGEARFTWRHQVPAHPLAASSTPTTCSPRPNTPTPPPARPELPPPTTSRNLVSMPVRLQVRAFGGELEEVHVLVAEAADADLPGAFR